MSVIVEIVEALRLMGPLQVTASDQARLTRLIVRDAHGDDAVQGLGRVGADQGLGLYREADLAIGHRSEDTIPRALGHLCTRHPFSRRHIRADHEVEGADQMLEGDDAGDVVSGGGDARIVGEAHAGLLMLSRVATGQRVADGVQ